MENGTPYFHAAYPKLGRGVAKGGINSNVTSTPLLLSQSSEYTNSRGFPKIPGPEPTAFSSSTHRANHWATEATEMFLVVNIFLTVDIFTISIVLLLSFETMLPTELTAKQKYGCGALPDQLIR